MDEDSLYLDEDVLCSLGSRGALDTADSHSHVHDQRKVNKTRCGLRTVSEFYHRIRKARRKVREKFLRNDRKTGFLWVFMQIIIHVRLVPVTLIWNVVPYLEIA